LDSAVEQSSNATSDAIVEVDKYLTERNIQIRNTWGNSSTRKTTKDYKTWHETVNN